MTEATRPPGRPRSETTRQAVLEAASLLLDNEAYRSISIERIASDAKVGKQSIYRWWDGKADVLLEAFTGRALSKSPTAAATRASGLVGSSRAALANTRSAESCLPSRCSATP